MNNEKILCIYHKDCADGFAAAWIVRKALAKESVEFYPATYQQEPPDVTGRVVYIVDFSYKREVMERMVAEAASIVVLDHHKTAEAELEPLLDKDVIGGMFDMEKSGCGLAWEWFRKFGSREEMPRLLQHIQDRDLWRFELDGTKEFTAALSTYPYDFELWDELVIDVENDSRQFRAEGRAILRKQERDVAALAETSAYFDVIAGHTVPVINAPFFYASDLGHLLAKNQPFAACYHDTENTRKYSLRSADNGLDVSEIAALFGGGGHKHAAGFSIPKNKLEMIKEANPC